MTYIGNVLTVTTNVIKLSFAGKNEKKIKSALTAIKDSMDSLGWSNGSKITG